MQEVAEMQEIKDRDVKQEGILKQWIQESSHIVFFGGAGVSTESGIPDFRSKDGLYNQEYAYPPETIISHSFFMRDPEEFYRFRRDLRRSVGSRSAEHCTCTGRGNGDGQSFSQ